MNTEQPERARPMSAHTTLKLASYQKPARRDAERPEAKKRAVTVVRRSAGQRVLRALFGT